MKTLATLSVCWMLFTACASQTFTVFEPKNPHATRPIVHSVAPTPFVGPIGTDSDGAATWGFEVVISQTFNLPSGGGSLITEYYPVEPYTLTGEVVAGSTKYEYQIGRPGEGYRRKCHFTATNDPSGVCVDSWEAISSAPEGPPVPSPVTFIGPVRAIDTVAVTSQSESSSPTSLGNPADNGARASHVGQFLIMGLSFLVIMIV